MGQSVDRCEHQSETRRGQDLSRAYYSFRLGVAESRHHHRRRQRSGLLLSAYDHRGLQFRPYERSGMVWRLREFADHGHDGLSAIRRWPSPETFALLTATVTAIPRSALVPDSLDRCGLRTVCRTASLLGVPMYISASVAS